MFSFKQRNQRKIQLTARAALSWHRRGQAIPPLYALSVDSPAVALSGTHTSFQTIHRILGKTPGCIVPAGTIEYATMTTPLPPPEGSAADSSTSRSSLPSFHGADASNYRAPAEAAALSLGRRVEFEAVAAKPGECVVHAQDCWHGSAPNVSAQRHRRALVVHFLRGDARFIDGHSLQVTDSGFV